MNGFGRGKDEQSEKKNRMITRETVGMTLLLFSLISFLIAVTGPYLFGDVGRAITAFFLGAMGFAVYPFLLLVAYLSLALVMGRSPIEPKFIVRGGLVLLCAFFIVHTATAPFEGLGYGEYLTACWNAAAESTAAATGGGVVLGIVAYPVRALLTDAGAYVLFAVLTALSLYLFLLATKLRARIVPSARRTKPSPVPAEAPQDARTEGAYPGGVQFGDLPDPPRAQLDENARSSAQPAADMQQPAMQRSRYADPAKDENRSILFGTDPAASYRNNLIYDKDSYFNTHARESNVKPVAAASDAPHPDYGESYSEFAESERPAFPRKVTEERPQSGGDGYSYPLEEDYDANYTQRPSYRAPQPPAPAGRDFYEHDVGAETFSSQPNVYEDPILPKEDAAEPPQTPSRFGGDPAPTPSRMGEDGFRSPSDFTDGTAEKGTEEKPANDEGFRGLFARQTENTDTASPYGDDASRVPSEFGRDTSAPRFPARETRNVPRDVPQDDGFGRADRENGGFGMEGGDGPDPDSRALKGIGSDAELFDNDDDFAEEPEEPAGRSVRPRIDPEERDGRDGNGGQKPVPAAKKHDYPPYVRPSWENFNVYSDAVDISQEENDRNTSIIMDTLNGFKVNAEVVNVTHGPAVTRYDIDIPRNITVGTVVKRDREIAMRLHARDGVNMYANNVSGAISIEVPNAHRAIVGIRSVLQAEEYLNAKEGSLMFVIGKDVENKSICGDIAKMKHLLVAGSTGSGKSVCLNAMLISLICKYSPEDLRLILIDPKKVEFAVFDGLPHLMINEIIADAQKAVTALKWAIEEMERRYRLFEQKTREQHNAVRSIDEYNAARTEDEEKIPKIVIVVDELADLMAVARKEIEERIQRLAQKARAAGIHLVLATQRPSVDVITGVIKGNLPTRIAFRVIQEVDSRTILDETGAEKLLGNGDMLLKTEGMFNCLRIQGAYLSSGEVQAIVDDIKLNNEAYFDDTVATYINSPGSSGVEGGDGDDGAANPQYIRALAIVVKLGQASISLIQRKCSVGYNHAGKIIEWMEVMGYISPFEGKAKARDVLLTKEEFEAKYGRLD